MANDVTPLVNPPSLTASALDPSNPRTAIRFARLDRHFGAGNWTEVFVDLMGSRGGTVRDQTGKLWDWWPVGKGGHLEKTPAK